MNVHMLNLLSELLETREELISVCKRRYAESSFTVDDYRLTLAILESDTYLLQQISDLRNSKH